MSLLLLVVVDLLLSCIKNRNGLLHLKTFGKSNTNAELLTVTLIVTNDGSPPSSSTSTTDLCIKLDRNKSFLPFVKPFKSDLTESNANETPTFFMQSDSLKKIKFEENKNIQNRK